jgi:hypothetical protein
VLEYSEFDANLTVRVADRNPVVIGLAVTSQVYVEIIP